jgi:hypothetical protein
VNIDLKNAIIIAFVSSSLTAAGFFGKAYFDDKNRKDLFVEELHKDLYDKGADRLRALNLAYSELLAAFNGGYALTSFELSPSYLKFQEAVESYQGYIREVERYGNSGQVQAAYDLSSWIIALYAEFNLQYETAQRVERQVRELLLVENPESEYFKSLGSALDSDLERLVQSENRVYYEADRYRKPVINSLEQHFNYRFRVSIGLDATKAMADAINALPEITKRKPENEYKDKKLPFMFSENRVFQAPTLEFEGSDEIFGYKNDALKQNAKMKFIALVIENDKRLQEILKDRKLAATDKN